MSEFIYLEGMVMVRSMEGEIKVKIKMRNSAQLHVIICHTVLMLHFQLIHFLQFVGRTGLPALSVSIRLNNQVITHLQ